jgi:hypothetical protein
MGSPADNYSYHDQMPQYQEELEPTNMYDEMAHTHVNLHEEQDIHRDNIQQLDNVLESINDS